MFMLWFCLPCACALCLLHIQLLTLMRWEGEQFCQWEINKMAVTLTATEPPIFLRHKLGPKGWADSVIKVRHPTVFHRDMLPFALQNWPSPDYFLHVVLPPFYACLNPWSDTKTITESTSQHSSMKQKGEDHSRALPAPTSPCCVALKRGWLLEPEGDTFNLSNVTQIGRKLKIKGEVLNCNWTAPCFNKVWHRSGINSAILHSYAYCSKQASFGLEVAV